MVHKYIFVVCAALLIFDTAQAMSDDREKQYEQYEERLAQGLLKLISCIRTCEPVVYLELIMKCQNPTHECFGDTESKMRELALDPSNEFVRKIVCQVAKRNSAWDILSEDDFPEEKKTTNDQKLDQELYIEKVQPCEQKLKDKSKIIPCSKFSIVVGGTLALCTAGAYFYELL